MSNKYELYTDGACSGNPGPMGIGCVIYKDNEIIETISVKKGHGTSNEAEYLAIIEGLTAVIKHNPLSVSVFSDSKLVISQINREFKVNSPGMLKLLNKVDILVANKDIVFNFSWVSRTENQVADNLASTAIGHNQGLIKNHELVEWDTSYIDSINKEEINNLKKINEKCSKLISEGNSKNENMKFGNFVKLKTYGVDEYSRLDEDELLKCIKIRFGQQSADWISKVTENTDSGYRKDALRWCARGLYPNLSLKKASVNAEMSNKLKNKTS